MGHVSLKFTPEQEMDQAKGRGTTKEEKQRKEKVTLKFVFTNG